MAEMYVCPVCLSEQKNSKRRRVSSEDCCVNCENFVKAKHRQYRAWLNPLLIKQYRSVNDRHPAMNPSLLKRVIKDVDRYGSFATEKEIIIVLRLLREKLYKRYDVEIHSHERYQLLTDALNMLDHLQGYRITQILHSATSLELSIQDYAIKNITVNKYVGMVGKALERITECALSYDGFARIERKGQQSMIWLLELAAEITVVNQIIEDVISLWHRGNLQINKNSWHWQLTSEDQKRHDKLLMGWSQDDVTHERATFGNNTEGLDGDEYIEALKKLRHQTEITGNSALGYDEEELICTINDIHKTHFGHRFSERLEAILTLSGLPKFLDRDWIFEDEITSFLGEKLGFSNDTSISILESLSINDSLLKSENANPFEFSRKYRLNRRPLPKIMLGKRNVYYLSVPLLARSFLHIQVEYSSANHPDLEGTGIKSEIHRLKQKYAAYFVKERIRPIFQQNGFPTDCHIETIGHSDLTREDCGEIDIIAFNKIQKELIIGECKHKVGKEIHVSQMRNEIQKFTEPDGYIEKLNRKANWVKNHVKDVLNHLKIEEHYDCIECTPIIITNYFCPASIFVSGIEFLMESELDSWCKRHINDEYTKL